MNTVDKPLSQSKVVSGVIAMVCVIAMLLMTVCALVFAERQLDIMTKQAEELGLQVRDQATIIEAQEELINLYREQNDSLSGILGQTVDVLDSLAYGPYSREEIQEIIAEVATIIAEVNEVITPAEVEEVSQAIVLDAVAAGVDPYLLLSMAIIESHCRPLARGGSGEFGMLQVMPATGSWIAGKMGYSEWELEELFDIQRNVQFATYYLRISILEFGGDIQKGVLAYNKGGKGARGWLKENSPLEHTYVRKVMNTYKGLTANNG